jgi:hypothetical protein
MTIKGTGELRKTTLIITIGLTLFVVGVMGELPESSEIAYLVTGLFVDAWLVAVMCPLLMMSGFLLMVIGFRKMFSGILN